MIAAWWMLGAAQAVTLTVNTATDSVIAGDGLTSLREALTAATSGDDIVFGFVSLQTIGLDNTKGPLPALPADVTLDGQQLALLDASTLNSGPGLSVSAGAIVLGMRIKGAAEACIEVTGDGARVGDTGSTDRNYLWSCKRSGILVGINAGSVTLENNVIGANSAGTVSGVCASPGSGACAGILHRSSDPAANTIEDNWVVGTLGTPASSQGAGILLVRGAGTAVSGNHVGITHAGTVSGNVWHGIAATAASGDIVSGLTITDNEVLDSEGSGIYIGVRADGSLVEDNLVGLAADFTVGGNADDGIELYASSDNHIEGNVVVASNQSGIHAWGSVGSHWQSRNTIRSNTVGIYLDTTWQVAGNGDIGILSEGQGVGTDIGSNLVSGNTSEGIAVIAPWSTVRGNRVGLDPLDDVLPNGSAGIVVGSDNAVVGGEASWGLLPVMGQGNLVCGNDGPGIVILDDTEDISVYGNVIGAGASGTGSDSDHGNAGSGILVAGGSGHIVGALHKGNVLVNNTIGIKLDGAGTLSGLRVAYNRVGIDADGELYGNTGDGIYVVDGVSDTKLSHNEVAGNGAVGVHLDATTSVEISENSVYDNDQCGILFDNDANETASALLVAPELEVRLDAGLSGTYTPPAGSYEVVSIEVFSDAASPSSTVGAEHRRFLGQAVLDTANELWTLEQGRSGIPTPTPSATARISAIMTVGIASGNSYTDLRSSDAGTFCGDGCAATGSGSCPMGDRCNVFDCNNTTDLCEDVGNALSTVACTDGDPCTANDHCSVGACVADAPTVCGVCSESIGVATFSNVVCDDDNPCTEDTCEAGSCVNRRDSVTCGDGNDCTAGVCDPVFGGCSNPPRIEGYACEDDNVCTGVGTCDGQGNCSGATDFGCPYEFCNGRTEDLALGIQWDCDPKAGCIIAAIETSKCDGHCDIWDLCPYEDAAPGAGFSSCPSGPTCAGCPEDCAPEVGGPDDDEDGIPDLWETGGIDMDCDGNITQPSEGTTLIGALGLTIDTPNVLVEIDYMGEGQDTGIPSDMGHDHELDVGAEGLGLVQTMFSAATPTPGYLLYINQDQEIAHQQVVAFGQAPPEWDCADWVGLSQRKLDPANFAPWRWGIFHYVLSGHQPEKCSSDNVVGIGETPGDDVLIAFRQPDLPGSLTRLQHERNTFMHETGHNLSLTHGGNSLGQTETVNYQSVMSYRLHYPGLVPVSDTGNEPVPDYSHQHLLTLDETALSEGAGVDYTIGDGPEYFLQYDVQNQNPPYNFKFKEVAPSDGPIDWNNNHNPNDAGIISADIDGDGVASHTMVGRDDWATLNLLMTCEPEYWMLGFAPGEFASQELSQEEAAERHILYTRQKASLSVCPGDDGGADTNDVASNGSGYVQLILYGTENLDVSDIDLGTVSVRNAALHSSATADFNSDTHDDLLMVVETADLGNLGTGGSLWVYASKDNSQVVIGQDDITWVSTTTDTDSDGVRNSCDNCPTVAATPPDADGCP